MSDAPETEKKCPCCGAREAFRYPGYTTYGGDCRSYRCKELIEHGHTGVGKPVACGDYVSWWTRLWRGCKDRTPHAHLHCTHCDARWSTSGSIAFESHYHNGFADGVKHAKKEMRP